MTKRKQHYIPVSYQKGFLEGYPDIVKIPQRDPFLFIFDREKREIHKKGIVNAFQYPHYYTIHHDNGEKDVSIENRFAENESNFSRISEILFREHILKPNLRCEILENASAKESLAYCIHLQWKRVPKYLKKTEEMLRESGGFEGENVAHNWNTLSMIDVGEGNHGLAKFHEIFLRKNWQIYCIVDPIKKFISSDAPVSFYNTTGIANDIIEIWIPINNKIVLRMFGPGTNVEIKYLFPKKYRQHDDHVDFMNTNIAQQSDQYFYSSNETYLKSIAKRINLGLKIEYYLGGK